jgi:hypothetical protein
MTVTVFVWRPRLAQREPSIGHASLAVDQVYISFWPGGTKHDLLPQPSVVNSISIDKRSEGRNPDYVSAPINGLDEKAIQKYWWIRKPGLDHAKQEMKIPLSDSTYNIITANCATIVWAAMLAGGLKAKYPAVYSAFALPLKTPSLIEGAAEMLIRPRSLI